MTPKDDKVAKALRDRARQIAETTVKATMHEWQEHGQPFDGPDRQLIAAFMEAIAALLAEAEQLRTEVPRGNVGMTTPPTADCNMEKALIDANNLLAGLRAMLQEGHPVVNTGGEWLRDHGMKVVSAIEHLAAALQAAEQERDVGRANEGRLTTRCTDLEDEVRRQTASLSANIERAEAAEARAKSLDAATWEDGDG